MPRSDNLEMEQLVVISRSIETTHAIAAIVANCVGPGGIICLCGELGSGKTEFVRGLVKAVGITAPVCSPSFVLENVYERDGSVDTELNRYNRVSHWDFYRTNVGILPEEILELSSDTSCLVVVEWPENVVGLEEHADVIISLFIDDISKNCDQLPNRGAEWFDEGVRLLKVKSINRPDILQEIREKIQKNGLY